MALSDDVKVVTVTVTDASVTFPVIVEDEEDEE